MKLSEHLCFPLLSGPKNLTLSGFWPSCVTKISEFAAKIKNLLKGLLSFGWKERSSSLWSSRYQIPQTGFGLWAVGSQWDQQLPVAASFRKTSFFSEWAGNTMTEPTLRAKKKPAASSASLLKPRNPAEEAKLRSRNCSSFWHSSLLENSATSLASGFWT